MTVQTERRTSLRKRPLSLVYVELGAANGGMMKDLGEEGFALRAMMPLAPEVNTVFCFSLDESTRIEGEAFIEWVEDKGRVAGLKFLDLPEHSRQKLQKWLYGDLEPTRQEMETSEAKPAPNFSMAELRTELRQELRPVPKIFAPPTANVSPAAQAEPPQVVSAPPVSVPATSIQAATPAPPLPATFPSWRKSPPSIHATLVPPAPVLEDISSKILPLAPDPIITPALELLPQPVRQNATPPNTDWLRGGTGLEPLPTLEEARNPNLASWMDRFTLTRAFGLLFVVALLAGSFVFHRELGQALIWLGVQISGAPEEQPAPANTPDGASPTSSSPHDSDSSPSAAATSEPQSGSIQADKLKNSASPLPAAPTPAETKSPEPQPIGEKSPLARTKSSDQGTLVPALQVDRTQSAPAPSLAVADIGQQEFQQALDILHSQSREAEVPEAVRLLWVAVEKGNVGAEVELAELYRTGKGVTRNCDQARILLSAAARKGNPQAQKNLDELQRQGCAE
jgi:PilZ domain